MLKIHSTVPNASGNAEQNTRNNITIKIDCMNNSRGVIG